MVVVASWVAVMIFIDMPCRAVCFCLMQTSFVVGTRFAVLKTLQCLNQVINI